MHEQKTYTQNIPLSTRKPEALFMSSAQRPGPLNKTKKQKQKPISSSGGVLYRRHPFGRYALVEEDD